MIACGCCDPKHGSAGCGKLSDPQTGFCRDCLANHQVHGCQKVKKANRITKVGQPCGFCGSIWHRTRYCPKDPFRILTR